MPLYQINGVEVDFPYEAYDVQKAYMGKVVEALKRKENALLESPTGTGKTLSLLCATLGWRISEARRLKDIQDAGVVALHARTTGSRIDPSVAASLRRVDEIMPDEAPPAGFDHRPAPQGAPLIVYASRTHSQLQQAFRELKRTAYKVRATILASRQQMCVHPRISRVDDSIQQQADCKREGVNCRHFRGYRMISEQPEKCQAVASRCLDIEELASLAKDGTGDTRGACPFYLTRQLAQMDAEVVFMPYNYLLEARTRETLSLRWDRAVVILDEAHNVEKFCSDAFSFDLPLTHLAAAAEEANTCREICLQRFQERRQVSEYPTLTDSLDKFMQAAGVASAPQGEQLFYELSDYFATVRALLMALLKEFDDIALQHKAKAKAPQGQWDEGPTLDGANLPGSDLEAVFNRVHITAETYPMVHQICEVAKEILLQAQFEQQGAGVGLGGGARRSAGQCRMMAVQEALRIAFHSFKGQGGPGTDKFRLYIHMSEGRSGQAPVPVVSYWCFTPGMAMQELVDLGVSSVVLTSGSLAPLDSFAWELQMPFPIRLENPHVIKPEQVWAGVISRGPSGHPLNSSFKTRDSVNYRRDLGLTVLAGCRIVPEGLLVFFPSYVLLTSLIEAWKNEPCEGMTIWERIQQFKQPVVEPRDSSDFAAAIDLYRQSLEAPQHGRNGAVMFAVFRGKASEGMDFNDAMGRGVILTGIPYAQRGDPRLILKRQIMDDAAKAGAGGGGGGGAKGTKMPTKPLTGGQWYVQEACRAVNQALGRVIRHVSDYGAILLCDERFNQRDMQQQLSLWIRPHVKQYAGFGEASANLDQFFRDRRRADVHRVADMPMAGLGGQHAAAGYPGPSYRPGPIAALPPMTGPAYSSSNLLLNISGVVAGPNGAAVSASASAGPSAPWGPGGGGGPPQQQLRGSTPPVSSSSGNGSGGGPGPGPGAGGGGGGNSLLLGLMEGSRKGLGHNPQYSRPQLPEPALGGNLGGVMRTQSPPVQVGGPAAPSGPMGGLTGPPPSFRGAPRPGPFAAVNAGPIGNRPGPGPSGFGPPLGHSSGMPAGRPQGGPMASTGAMRGPGHAGFGPGTVAGPMMQQQQYPQHPQQQQQRQFNPNMQQQQQQQQQHAQQRPNQPAQAHPTAFPRHGMGSGTGNPGAGSGLFRAANTAGPSRQAETQQQQQQQRPPQPGSAAPHGVAGGAAHLAAADRAASPAPAPGGPGAVGTSSAAAASKASQHGNLLTGFLEDVRSTTGPQGFAQLQTLMRAYKQTKDVVALIDGATTLFTNPPTPDRLELLRKMRLVIPKASQPLFDDRTARWIGNAPSEAAGAPAATAAAAAAAAPVPARAAAPPAPVSAAGKRPADGIVASGAAAKKPVKEDPYAIHNGAVLLRPPTDAAAAMGRPGAAGPVLAPSAKAPPCVVCGVECKAAHAAPCGHLGCYACWLGVIGKTGLCPVCKHLVKNKAALQRKYMV